MNLLIIIPTYNEAQNIEKLIVKIENVIKEHNFSILIVDDSSPDSTAQIVSSLKNKYKNIILMTREGKLGLASAYIEGFKYGLVNNFDAFIQMDADYLQEMIEHLQNYDVVIGSRNIKGGSVPDWGFIRNIISKGGSLYSRLILDCPIRDLTGGFNAWGREIIQKINLDRIISKGYSFQIEMKYKAYKNKARIIEFPIVFEDRKLGNSKMSKEIFFEALINVIKIKLNCLKPF